MNLERLTYDGRPVRIHVQQGEPWFCLADVGRVLGMSNPRDFLKSDFCDVQGGVETFYTTLDTPEDRPWLTVSQAAKAQGVSEKTIRRMIADGRLNARQERGARGDHWKVDPSNLTVAAAETADGPGAELTYISEPNLYALIMRSNKPEARAFSRWVTHEVLPQIRKTGRYEAAPPPPQSGDPILALLSGVAQMRQAQLDQEARIARLERTQEEARQALDALPAPQVEAPELTDTARCIQAVEAVARLSGKGHQEVWREAYREYELRLKVRITRQVDDWNQMQPPKHRLTKLQWIERFGDLPRLYAILIQMKRKLAESQVA